MSNKSSVRTLRLSIAALLFVCLTIPSVVLAQTDFGLNINKIIGYGIGNKIAGTFTFSLIGPEDQVASVDFMIDGQSMGVVSQAPFRVRFETKTYAYGNHEFSAAVTLKDGQVITVGPSLYIFPTSDEQRSGMMGLIVPILGIVLVAALFTTVIPMLSKKHKPGSVEPGTVRSYGISGGAICPKCKRPTPRHPFGLNLVVGKLDRCENCGKWSILRAEPIEVLRAAEQAEREHDKTAAAMPEKSEEEKLKELLDKSKYTE